MNTRVPITPQTRVAELLNAYPDLEAVLIAQAPAFKALKNPILRRTVAKVATLQKAAEMADIPIRDLIRTLRAAAGQPLEDATSSNGDLEKYHAEESAVPEWLDQSKIAKEIDADDLLEAGQFPLAIVQNELKVLRSGEVLCINSSFRPVPLMEALQNKYRLGVHRTASNRFRLYIQA